MFYAIFKLKLKQAVGEFGFRAALKFLAPDFFIGVFLAFSSKNESDASLALRLGMVSCGVALFTLVVETRKLFFTGGDLENFYFIQPTRASRSASLSAVIVLNLVIIFSVILPSVISTFPGSASFTKILSVCISAACFSSTLYLLMLFAVASMPRRAADLTLTILQIAMALALLSTFQLPSVAENLFGLGNSQITSYSLSLFSCFMLIVACSVFLAFPVQEGLISKLNQYSAVARVDLASFMEHIKGITMIASKEEEAGFMFFLSNIFRNSSFRLSTIGIAAMPIMIAIYWSVRGVYFLSFTALPAFFTVELVAPLASLTISGIMVYYFLSQNVLSSKDYEAKWMLKANSGFDVGKYMLGIRKSLLLVVHVPMVVVIFFIMLTGESILLATISALTYCFLTMAAASWFFIMQKRLPFSLPFTQIGSVDLLGMVSMFGYSFLVVIVLYFSYGNLENLLIVNLVAFLLIRVLELLSVKIVNSRVKFV